MCASQLIAANSKTIKGNICTFPYLGRILRQLYWLAIVCKAGCKMASPKSLRGLLPASLMQIMCLLQHSMAKLPTEFRWTNNCSQTPSHVTYIRSWVLFLSWKISSRLQKRLMLTHKHWRKVEGFQSWIAFLNKIHVFLKKIGGIRDLSKLIY